LKQQAFRKLKRRWMKCEVDLFAVAWNCQLEFYSWRPQSGAVEPNLLLWAGKN
jgi:hypothetical protein